MRAEKLLRQLDKCVDLQHCIVGTYSVKTAFIYALRCPNTGLIRYIGKCVNSKKRLGVHLADSRRTRNHRTNWLRSLSTRGLKPTLEIIARVPADAWQFWERSYIRLYRCLGFDLVNGTDGGEGFESGENNPMFGGGSKHPNFGKKLSATRCESLRLSALGRKMSDEAVEKMIASKTNKKNSTNTSGFVGVGWDSFYEKWYARIPGHKKKITIGRFSKKEDAVFVRALAFDKYYGNK